jgi:hypothetical protein
MRSPWVPLSVGALFAVLCVAGLAVTVYGVAATPNPAYVAVVCGMPAVAAGVVAGIAFYSAAEARRRRTAVNPIAGLASGDVGQRVPHG